MRKLTISLKQFFCGSPRLAVMLVTLLSGQPALAQTTEPGGALPRWRQMRQPQPNPSSNETETLLNQAAGDAASTTASQWEQLAGPETGYCTAITVRGNRVFVGTLGGIFFSDDEGQTWRRSPGSPGTYVSFDIVANGNTLLYGVDGFDSVNFGVLRSSDDGLTWQRANNGLPPGVGVQRLAVKGSTIFLATQRAQVFRSNDNGDNWTASGNGLPANLRGVNALWANAAGLLANTEQGPFRSDDGGVWVKVNLTLPPGVIVTNSAATSTRFFLATTGAGVLGSNDGGQTWFPVNNGLPANAVVSSLKVDRNRDSLYATTAVGALYVSSDNGATWSARAPQFGVGRTIVGVVNSGGALLTVTLDGVIRSTDDGRSWSRSNKGFRAAEVETAPFVQGRRLYVATQGGVWLSEDRGETWTLLDRGINPLALGSYGATIVWGRGRTLFAGIDGDGVYRSRNRGRNWERTSDGLPEGLVPFSLNAVRGKLYLGTFGSGAFVSDDDGDSWQAVPYLPEDATFFAPIKALRHRIFAASYGAGIFLSTDEGESWVKFNDGLRDEFFGDLQVYGANVLAASDEASYRLRADLTGWDEIRSYAATAMGGANGLIRAGGVLYATTFGRGLWASADDGATWRRMNDGMLTNRAFSFAHFGNDIVVGSSGNGLFRLRDAGRQ